MRDPATPTPSYNTANWALSEIDMLSSTVRGFIERPRVVQWWPEMQEHSDEVERAFETLRQVVRSAGCVK